MPNLYDRSYNPYTQDGDDCPPNPFSMAYGGNEPEGKERDAWDFIGMSKNQRENEQRANEVFRQRIVEDIGRNRMVHNCDRKTYKFLTILKETEKAWLLKFTENDDGAWFPKSLCERTGMKISGPASFMDKKIRELLLTLRETVKIGTQLERCPYCGKDTGCDCASPGHKPKVTLIPAPPADLAAQIAKAKLKKFVEENRPTSSLVNEKQAKGRVNRKDERYETEADYELSRRYGI